MFFDFINGGIVYDAARFATSAQQMAQNPAAMFFGALAFLGGFLQQYGSVRVGFKDKSYGAIPMFATAFFFAHDTTFTLTYDHWFHETGYFMMKALWYCFPLYAIFELFGIYLILKYGRDELFPKMSLPAAVISYIGLQIFAYAGFWWLMSVIVDPLYLYKFAITIIVSPMFSIPMMRMRGSRRGFSPTALYGILLLVAAFWAWLFAAEPTYFLQPKIVVVAIANTAMAIVSIWYWYKLPPYQPQVTN